MTAQAGLVAIALWIAWRPWETVAATPLVVAAAALALVPWAVRRTAATTLRAGMPAAAAAVALVAASGLFGQDPASGMARLALFGATGVTLFLASREAPSELASRVLALGLALLALWAVWQVTVGFERAALALDSLPQELRGNAAARLASGRGFASMILPSHLAAVLATALPVLVAGAGRSAAGVCWLAGGVLCVIGLIVTHSPIGIALAAAASMTLVAKGRHWLAPVLALVLVVGLATTFVSRPDLGELEPLALRADNWRTALWVWSTSPVAGVGLGGYGQASQTVPFAVGNRPAHAHSLPLEWAAEFGIVGVAAALAGLLWLVRLLLRLWPVRPDLAVALAVVPLHNLVDFSLYTSGVAMTWAVLAGWGWAVVRQPVPGDDGRRYRVVVVTAATLGVAVALLHTTSVLQSRAADAEAHPAARHERADAAHRLAPWRADPVAACAVSALEAGDPDLIEAASQTLARSRWLRPGSASWAALASRLALAAGRVPTAVSEAWEAVQARPFEADHQRRLRALTSRLAEAEHGREP